jgi:hypothetical protein
LNADLCEGFGVWRLGDDEAMLRLVTGGNIACGFHAGDPAGLARTCRAGAAQGVESVRKWAIAISPVSGAAISMSPRRISLPT